MFYAIALKLLLVPVFAYAYWLVAIKGGNWLVNTFITNPKIRHFLTKDRYC